jgi:hypothetical protein
MVVHKAVGVTQPVITLVDMLKGVEEILAVLIVFKDSLLFVAARGDVVNGSGVFYAKGAGHAETLAEKEQNVKIKYLTL